MNRRTFLHACGGALATLLVPGSGGYRGTTTVPSISYISYTTPSTAVSSASAAIDDLVKGIGQHYKMLADNCGLTKETVELFRSGKIRVPLRCRYEED